MRQRNNRGFQLKSECEIRHRSQCQDRYLIGICTYRFDNQLGSRDIRDTQRPWQRLLITRLPLLKPRHISSEWFFSAFAQVNMFGAEPGHQTIKMQSCIIHRHIAEDRSCANDFDPLVSQKENQRRAIVDLGARRSQADIGVNIDKLLTHLLKAAEWHILLSLMFRWLS